MQADQPNIPVGSVAVTVSLKRDHPEEAIFEYTIQVDGVPSTEQHAALLQAAENCPVKRTLLKKLAFQRRC